MKRYEHKMVSVRDLVGLEQTLEAAVKGMDRLGARGWRLVAVLGDQAAVFVREAQSTEEPPEPATDS